VSVDGNRLESRFVAIAAGSKPAALPIPGAEHLLTSDDSLDLHQLPGTIAFIGGGYISFEFAHIAARAGAKPTILHEDNRLLAHFDRDLVERVLDKSRRVGIDIRFDSRVDRIEEVGGGVRVYANGHGANEPVEAGMVVHGAGRIPDIDDLDLDAGGIERDGRRLRLTPHLQSASNPAVYAAGDAAATGPMLTPVSEIDGEVVAENLLAGTPKHVPDYRGVPSAVFTIPPLASVGLTEQEARDRNLNFRVQQADVSGWYSARRVREDTAAFKVLIENGSDRVLGAHIIGPNAEEAINLFALTIRLGLSTRDLRRVVPAYPSEGSNLAYMLG
jgi:glutathione reductase (NADPH)